MDIDGKSLINSIFARRSIRNYIDKEVENEKLIFLLKAAMAAPSAEVELISHNRPSHQNLFA